MKMSIAIMVAILLFMPIVSGTNTITDVQQLDLISSNQVAEQKNPVEK